MHNCGLLLQTSGNNLFLQRRIYHLLNFPPFLRIETTIVTPFKKRSTLKEMNLHLSSKFFTFREDPSWQARQKHFDRVAFHARASFPKTLSPFENTGITEVTSKSSSLSFVSNKHFQGNGYISRGQFCPIRFSLPLSISIYTRKLSLSLLGRTRTHFWRCSSDRKTNRESHNCSPFKNRKKKKTDEENLHNPNNDRICSL